MKWTVAAAALALLSGCATGMSEEDCAYADWRAIGERDGLYGEGLEKLAERREQCAAFGFNASLADYEAGRERGLFTYCTPDGGYDAGRNGRPYRGVCPAETEGAFLSEYKIGYRLFELNKAVEDAIAAYDGAIAGLEEARYNLRRARERFRDSTLSEDERHEAGEDIERHRRRIDDLEYDLPRLEARIRDAEGRLEDYRAFLARRAR